MKAWYPQVSNGSQMVTRYDIYKKKTGMLQDVSLQSCVLRSTGTALYEQQSCTVGYAGGGEAPASRREARFISHDVMATKRRSFLTHACGQPQACPFFIPFVDCIKCFSFATPGRLPQQLASQGSSVKVTAFN